VRRIFVYGTLLRDEPNHLLLREARLVGEGLTAPIFELRDLGAFPGMVSGGISAIAGEVYEVDSTTLAAVDRFEGHPQFYHRTDIVLADGTSVEAYLLRPDQVRECSVIPSGSWRMNRTH
jgi:gamma-glutamylaminecyclotransferase